MLTIDKIVERFKEGLELELKKRGVRLVRVPPQQEQEVVTMVELDSRWKDFAKTLASEAYAQRLRIQREVRERADRAELAELDPPAGTGGDFDDAILEALEKNVLEFTDRCMAIRSDDRLGDVGKAEALKKAYQAAHKRFEALRDKFTGDVDTRRKRLYDRALRPVGSVLNRETVIVSFRDARDRAARLSDPADLLALASSAELSGDENLRRACMAVAYEQGFGHFLAQELEDEPLAELLEFDEQYPSDWAENRIGRLTWAEPDRPNEIDRVRLTGVGVSR